MTNSPTDHHNDRHGHSKGGVRSPTYIVWQSMIQRCNDPKHKSYHRYGGRGIYVDPAWHDFAIFLTDMGEVPDGMQIDRIDSDGPYEPGNVRWVTPKQNSQNRHTTRWFTHNGETMCVTDWADHLGFSVQGLLRRIDNLGWSVERALTTPPRKQRNRKDTA